MRIFNTQSCLLFAVMVISACSEEVSVPLDDGITGRPVKVIRISDAALARSSAHPAVIRAARTRELGFSVSGRLLELLVNETQVVKQGDVIARLDTRDFDSSLAASRAAFENAETEYQRAVRLSAQDAIAANILEQRLAQRDQAKAQLDSAAKALEDATIVAPFDGVIADVSAREGDTVSPAATIATLISVDTLEASIQLPASVIASAQTRRDLGSFVVFDAEPDLEIPALFAEADLIADATSQTYTVSYAFTPPSSLLVLPGMNARVVLRSQEDSSVARTSIPLAAIQSDGGGQYVWVVEGDPLVVSRRDVTLEAGVGENMIVTSGLAAGDRIVGAGGAYLSAGMEVSLWQE